MASGRASDALKGALAALVLTGAAAADTPARVVSMNLCTDQLAMMLAAPGQLISVSDVASDPQTSPMHAEAAAYPANYGSAEEIFLMQPDLVVAGIYSDPVAIDMLRRLGIRVEQLPLVERLDQVTERVAQMGALLGRDAAAQSLNRQFETDLAALRAPSEDGPVTAFYYPNGYTLGTETLSDDILRAAGFVHLSERLGRRYSGRMPLELLAVAAPEMIVTARPYPGASRSEALLDHPVLAQLTAPHGPVYSGNEWICGTPFVTRALGDLAAARAERRQ